MAGWPRTPCEIAQSRGKVTETSHRGMTSKYSGLPWVPLHAHPEESSSSSALHCIASERRAFKIGLHLFQSLQQADKQREWEREREQRDGFHGAPPFFGLRPHPPLLVARGNEWDVSSSWRPGGGGSGQQGHRRRPRRRQERVAGVPLHQSRWAVHTPVSTRSPLPFLDLVSSSRNKKKLNLCFLDSSSKHWVVSGRHSVTLVC